MKFSFVDLYILKKCIRHNVGKAVNNIISTNKKKFYKLTKDKQIQFTIDQWNNRSGYKLIEEEVKILRYSLNHPIEPKYLLKTDIMVTSEQLHSLLCDLKGERMSGELKSTIPKLANVCWFPFKPNQIKWRKHGILKNWELERTS